VKPWVVRDADTSKYLGRVLARDEPEAHKLAGEFWPKHPKFTITPAGEEVADDDR